MADETPKTIVREGAIDPTAWTHDQAEVVPMAWWKIVLVRVSRVYLQSLAGFLTANLTGFTSAVLETTAGVELPASAFLTKLLTAASMAVAPAAFTLLQNFVEILTALDVKRPGLRA